MSRSFFLTTCTLAALVPLLQRPAPSPLTADFVGWPERFEGRVLEPMQISEAEARFARGFPGRIATFSDGQRHVILRYVTARTRKLHPAADCYRGLGYRIEPQARHTDEHGHGWGAFRAMRRGRRLWVRERINSMDGTGWSDVSSWYWAALLGRTTGPWWSVTVVETALRDPGAIGSGWE